MLIKLNWKRKKNVTMQKVYKKVAEIMLQFKKIHERFVIFLRLKYTFISQCWICGAFREKLFAKRIGFWFWKNESSFILLDSADGTWFIFYDGENLMLKMMVNLNQFLQIHVFCCNVTSYYDFPPADRSF
jgi:hypothetical protein